MKIFSLFAICNFPTGTSIIKSNYGVQLEDEVMRKVLKETQDRVRLFEEKQRRWQEQQQLPTAQ